MEQRKTPKRREYLNDFKMNEDGKYQYEGILHSLDETEFSYDKVKKIYLSSILGILLMYIIAGSVRAVGVMNAVFVTLPYVFGFFAAGVLTYKVGSLVFGRYPIRDYDFNSTVLKFKGLVYLVLILTKCTLIGELFYVIKYGIKMYLSGTIVFFACMLGALVISIFFGKFNDKLRWKTNK